MFGLDLCSRLKKKEFGLKSGCFNLIFIMDAKEFKECAKAAVDFIVDYYENLSHR